MLYVMATGQKPFPSGRTGHEEPPDPRRAAPNVADGYAALCMRAMALEPRNRFPSADVPKGPA